jgi:hypothetical protein
LHLEPKIFIKRPGVDLEFEELEIGKARVEGLMSSGKLA